MRQFADAGEILPSDSVWKEGTVQQVPASRIRNLFTATAQPPMLVEAEPLPAEAIGVTAVPAAMPAAATEALADDVTPGADPPGQARAAAAPSPAAPAKPAAEVIRPKRVTSIRGGILCSQDGVSVRYRKKCVKCGHEDAARCSAAIRNGSMRIPFYCPKCRKARCVEMTAIVG
jgi:hypothetical protein